MRFVEVVSLAALMINDLFSLASLVWAGLAFAATLLGKKSSESWVMGCLFPMSFAAFGQIALALTDRVDQQVGLLIGLPWWGINLILGGTVVLFIATFILGRLKR